MAPPSPRRRWLQFGLRSLILLIVVCALGLTWWRQWKLEGRLEHSARQEQELKFNDERNHTYLMLDLEIEKHRVAFECLRAMPPIYSTCERLSLWTGPNKFQVVIFRCDTHSIPGSRSTVVLLVEDDRLVDAVSRKSYGGLWEEHHQAKLEDGNGDGIIDLVIHCEHSRQIKSGTTIVYQFTPDGFCEAGRN